VPNTRKTDAAMQADRVAQYRESAQALRVLAFRHFNSEEARRIVLETAEKYDRLADAIERRVEVPTPGRSDRRNAGGPGRPPTVQ